MTTDEVKDKDGDRVVKPDRIERPRPRRAGQVIARIKEVEGEKPAHRGAKKTAAKKSKKGAK